MILLLINCFGLKKSVIKQKTSSILRRACFINYCTFVQLFIYFHDNEAMTYAFSGVEPVFMML